MTIVEMQCAVCHKLILLTETPSLYRAGGGAYQVFCHDCYLPKPKEPANE